MPAWASARSTAATPPRKRWSRHCVGVNAVSEAAVLAREVVAEADADRGAVEALPWREANHRRHRADARNPGGGEPISGDLAAASEELRSGLDQLVERDVQGGLVPRGFTTADVMQLLLHLRPALPFPREQADALHLRYLGFAMRGLREQALAGDQICRWSSLGRLAGHLAGLTVVATVTRRHIDA